MDVEEAIKKLENEKNIKFKELLKICEEFFEGPKVSGSHHIFKTPWRGHPRINIQSDKKTKKMAKSYQVKQVKEALKKLKELSKGEGK